MKEKIYKCSFKHCQHSLCEVLQGEAVQVGNRYMHQDCFLIYQNIGKIRDIYYDQISNTVVMKQLLGVINDIIFKKGVDSSYFLFALNHAIKSKIQLNSPYGLHYLVDNHRIKELWTQKKAREIADQIKGQNHSEPQIDKKAAFIYSQQNTSGFGGIMRGGREWK